jgi:hypothetical protein
MGLLYLSIAAVIHDYGVAESSTRSGVFREIRRIEAQMDRGRRKQAQRPRHLGKERFNSRIKQFACAQ